MGARSLSIRVGLALCIVLSAACAVAPRPLYVPVATGRSYGFEDFAHADATYRVVYHAPVEQTDAMYGRADREQKTAERLALAYDLALRRAAEIAVARGIDSFVVKDRQNTVDVRDRLDPLYDPFFDSPMFYRDRFGRRRLLDPWPSSPRYDRISEIRVSVQLTVAAAGAVVGESVPARATLERLQRLYPDPPPTAR